MTNFTDIIIYNTSKAIFLLISSDSMSVVSWSRANPVNKNQCIIPHEEWCNYEIRLWVLTFIKVTSILKFFLYARENLNNIISGDSIHLLFSYSLLLRTVPLSHHMVVSLHFISLPIMLMIVSEIQSSNISYKVMVLYSWIITKTMYPSSTPDNHMVNCVQDVVARLRTVMHLFPSITALASFPTATAY